MLTRIRGRAKVFGVIAVDENSVPGDTHNVETEAIEVPLLFLCIGFSVFGVGYAIVPRAYSIPAR